MFRWFFPGVLQRESRESVVFTKPWRKSRLKLGGFIKYQQSSCLLLKCNRKVTLIFICGGRVFIQE